jgi:hypothetical protein
MNEEQDLSLNQQIEYVRRFGEAWPLGTVAAACTLICVAAFYAFVVASHQQLKVVLLFVAGVSGLLVFAILSQLPRLKRAARATRMGRRTQAVLNLTVDQSDSESLVISGEVVVGSTVWQLHFGRPLGWVPASGEWPCAVVMLDGEPLPALVELSQGLLFPTPKSRKAFGAAPGV